MMFSGIVQIMLLVALGMGYIVLYFAQREEGLMKITGYIVGTVIVVLIAAQILASFFLGFNFMNPQCQRDKIIRKHMLQQEKMMQQQRPTRPGGMMQKAPAPPK